MQGQCFLKRINAVVSVKCSILREVLEDVSEAFKYYSKGVHFSFSQTCVYLIKSLYSPRVAQNIRLMCYDLSVPKIYVSSQGSR